MKSSVDLKIAYTSDVHGCDSQYRDFLSLAKEYRADLIIVGGDLFPKKQPTIQQAIADQHSYLVGTFIPMLAEHRRSTGADILLLMGNDDVRVHEELFEFTCAKAGLLTLHEQCHTIKGWQIFGNSCVTFTPFLLKDWEVYDCISSEELRPDSVDYRFPGTILTKDRSDWHRTIAMRLEESARQILDWSRSIAVIHQPPHGGILDQLWNGQFAGSLAVRRFIEQRQPALAFHGHIHESPSKSGRWHERIGRTCAIQPGQDFVKLHAVTLCTSDIPGSLQHSIFGTAERNRDDR